MTNDATEHPHFRASNTVILLDAVRIVEITVSLQRVVFSLEQVTVELCRQLVLFIRAVFCTSLHTYLLASFCYGGGQSSVSA